MQAKTLYSSNSLHYSRGMHHTSSYTHAHTTAFPFEEVFQTSSSHKGELVLLLSLINHRLDTEGFTYNSYWTILDIKLSRRDRRQEPSPLENMEPSIQADTNQPSDPVDEEPVKVTRGKVVQSESLQNQEFLENKRFSCDLNRSNDDSSEKPEEKKSRNEIAGRNERKSFQRPEFYDPPF
ncbi:LOW QUALITY PROTEIN: hypothetical protein V1478_013728 [Vespula squamosa]|uniref:Uncharacterized protein n=1 Tax=Vespula squamosa TaxID=30214 RepID=A0ABD2A6B3_VESSQ